MSDADAEVGTELTLDDKASSVLDKVKSGFGSLEGTVRGVAGTIGGMFMNTISTALGVQLSASLDAVKDGFREMIGEALETEQEIRSLTSVLTILDQTGASWEKQTEGARNLHAELGEISAKAYALQGDMVQVFDQIAYRTGRSADEVLRLTENAALAGRAVPGGAAALARGFAEVENGAIRAKNPIVQLLKATGMVEGSAKEIAKGLQELYKKDPTAVFEMADAAVSRMAAKMKDVPPTFDEMVTSMKEMKADVFEAAGVPILRALTPQFEKLRRYFQENGEQVEEWARKMGDKVGEWAVEAAELMKEGFEYLENHADEIKQALKDGWGFAKEVAEFIVAHKEELQLAATLYAGGRAYGAAKGVVGGAIDASKTLSAGTAAQGVFGAGAGMGATTATIAALGALAAAIAAVGLAAYQAGELMRELEEIQDNHTQKMGALQDMVNKGNVEGVERWVETQKAMWEEANPGEVMPAEEWNILDSYIMEAQAAKDRLETGMVDEALAFEMAMNEAAQKAEEAYGDAAAINTEAARMQANAIIQEQVGAIVAAYNAAQVSGNVAAMQYAADTLAGSQVLQDALFESGLTISGGILGLADMLSDATDKFANKLRSVVGDTFSAPKAGKANFSLSGGGSVTINIKQDFRDKDPDRAFFVFKRGLEKLAAAPTQPKGGIPGGM